MNSTRGNLSTEKDLFAIRGSINYFYQDLRVDASSLQADAPVQVGRSDATGCTNCTYYRAPFDGLEPAHVDLA